MQSTNSVIMSNARET